MKNKFFSVLVAAIFCSFIFSGCPSKDNNQEKIFNEKGEITPEYYKKIIEEEKESRKLAGQEREQEEERNKNEN